MDVQLTLILSVILFTLNRSKISNLILTIQALVVSIVVTIYLHTNLTYLSYSIIYVYVGAICVLFLYFMMLLQNKTEIHGTNTLFALYLYLIMEVTCLLISFFIFTQHLPEQYLLINLYDSTYNIEHIAETLVLHPLTMTMIIFLFLYGVIIPLLNSRIPRVSF
jgi:NADH:ubiquinone oxidoreductase subunit 6 (subunit J)